jgi:hypothetical protein
MKLFKSISIIIFILISWNVRATNVENDSTKRNDENTKLNIFNIEPEDEEDEYIPLTRDVLLDLSKSGEYKSIYYSLYRNPVLKKKAFVYVSYKVDNFNYNQNYKLLCSSDSGIFVYDNYSIEFIPFKSINFIQRSRNFNTQLKIMTYWGLGLGAIVSISIGEFISIIAVPAVIDAYFIGGYGTYYFFAKYVNSFRFRINYLPKNGISFISTALKKSELWGQNLQLTDYPFAKQTKKEQVKSEIPEPKIEKDSVISNEIIISNPTISNSTKDSLIVVPIKRKTPELKVELPNLNNAKGKLNPQWLYLSFTKLDVNENKLMAKFKNIQGTQMIAENLQNLNTSELQFLAITIATLNGYNFRNITSFSESQSQYLLNNEPYLAFEIKPDSEIDPSNFQELDLNNIKLIYAVLKEKKELIIDF